MCDLNVNPKTKTVKHKIGVLGKGHEDLEGTDTNSTFVLNE